MTRVVQPTDVKRSLERSKSAFRRGRPAPQSPITPYEITLVVLGSIKVGKSALVSQFLWEGFVSEYRPTVEDFNWIEYDIGQGQQLMLQVIDSSGSRDFLAMRQLYMRTGNAFLVVFSLDDAESFEEAKKIIEEILEQRGKQVPIVLVANKRDLFKDIGDWKVKDAYQYAYKKTIPILEVSAKNQTEAADAFHEVLERLRDQHSIGISDLRKRRQSMPSTPGFSGVDKADIEKLKKRHKSSCVIS